MEKNDIFAELAGFGLSKVADEKKDVYESEDKPAPKPKVIEKSAEEFRIDDYIYSKKFHCPVCEVDFETYVTKDSKLRRVTTEYDLRPVYAPIEPMLYDVIVCDKCGYAAYRESFNVIGALHAKRILDEITPNFKPTPYPKEPTIDEAITRHKLVLLNAIVKKAKDGERAYVCMKLTWLYRIKEDAENEKTFARLACEGFTKALAEEHSPPAGLPETTVLYLIASFSVFLEDYARAVRVLSDIIISPKTSKGMKERAMNLKDELRERRGNEKGDGEI